MSASRDQARAATRAAADRWAAGREVLRAADPRMAALVEADPGLDPDHLLEGWPRDLWGALVLQVIGQQLSRAAAASILARLEALHDGRLPTAAQLLRTDTETLRGIGLSRRGRFDPAPGRVRLVRSDAVGGRLRVATRPHRKCRLPRGPERRSPE